MRKRFIVALASANEEQDQAFREFIRSAGLGWWHWLPRLWLLVDLAGEYSAAQIRDKSNEFYPGVYKLVIELGPEQADETWAGFGPTSTDRHMFNWIANTWGKKE